MVARSFCRGVCFLLPAPCGLCGQRPRVLGRTGLRLRTCHQARPSLPPCATRARHHRGRRLTARRTCAGGPRAGRPSIEAAAEETGPANTPDAADAAAAADTSGGGPAANIDPTATATPDGDAPTDTTPSSADAAVPPAAADATTPPDANSATAPAPAVAAANATAEAGQPQPKATATTAADSADTGGAAVVVPNADQAGSAEAGVDLDLDEQKPLLLQGPGELPPTKVSGFNEDGTLDLSPGEQSRVCARALPCFLSVFCGA